MSDSNELLTQLAREEKTLLIEYHSGRLNGNRVIKDAFKRLRETAASATRAIAGDAGAWQPIETATKMRSVEIQVYCEDTDEQMVAFWNGGWQFAVGADKLPVHCKPTHWRPTFPRPERSTESNAPENGGVA